MSDRLHDHLTFGFRRGCVACAQVEADLAMSRRALADGRDGSAPQPAGNRALPGERGRGWVLTHPAS